MIVALCTRVEYIYMLEKQEPMDESLYLRLVTVVAAILVVVLGLLEVVLSLATKHGTCYGTEDAVSAHQASVTLLLHSRITGSVLLLSRLTVRVLALGVLILTVGTLLRELILGLRAGVASLLVLAMLSNRDVSFCFETIFFHCAYPCCCWL